MQTERQQLATAGRWRKLLDAYLVVAPAAGRPAAETYAHVLAWKGAVLLREQRRRIERRRPDLAADWTRLRGVTARLAKLALSDPELTGAPGPPEEIRRLTEEKERLEADLARQSSAFSRERQARTVRAADLLRALPPDTALIDFLEYQPARGVRSQQAEGPRLLAFVVRTDSVRRVELGPAGPIARAVDRWRRRLERAEGPAAADGPAAELRRAA